MLQLYLTEKTCTCTSGRMVHKSRR